MFDAFKVGVTVELNDQVTPALTKIIAAVAKAEKRVIALQKRLDALGGAMPNGVSGLHKAAGQANAAKASVTALHGALVGVAGVMPGGPPGLVRTNSLLALASSRARALGQSMRSLQRTYSTLGGGAPPMALLTGPDTGSRALATTGSRALATTGSRALATTGSRALATVPPYQSIYSTPIYGYGSQRQLGYGGGGRGGNTYAKLGGGVSHPRYGPGVGMGAPSMAAGYMAYRGIQGLIKPGMEYADQLQRLRGAGLSEEQIRVASQQAWRASAAVMTSSANEAGSTILDLRGVLDKLPSDAILQHTLRAEAVMRTAGLGETARDSALYAMKVVDMLGRGLAPGKEPDDKIIAKQVDYMTKVALLTNNMVTPKTFKGVVQYMRGARGTINDEFLYEILPTIMLDYANRGGAGGGRSGGAGTLVAAFDKAVVQGVMSKGAVDRLSTINLVNSGTVRTTTMGTQLKSGLVGADVAARNPYEWVTKYLIPAIERKHGDMSDQQVLSKWIKYYFAGTTGTSIDLITQLATRSGSIDRGQKQLRGVASPYDLYMGALENGTSPMLSMISLQAQWNNLLVSLTINVAPHLIYGMTRLSEAFGGLAQFFVEFPTIAKITGFGLLLGGVATVIAVVAAAFSLPVWGTLAVVAAGIMGVGVALGLIEAKQRGDTAARNGTPIAKPGSRLATDYATAKGQLEWIFPSLKQQPPSFQVFLDGQQIAATVIRRQGDILNRPGANGSSSNGFPQFPGVGAGQ